MVKDKRSYHVFFNVHTVSGIVISVGLFVIFLAGAFALFQWEINNWHHDRPERPFKTNIDYDRVIELVKQQGYEMKGRTLVIRYYKDVDHIKAIARPLTDESDSSDTTINAKNTGLISLCFDPETYEILEKTHGRAIRAASLGRYLYHLHYFGQIPIIGKYLAGFIALFFGLAILSGLVIHWKKIISNFFTFRIKSNLKNLWTDGHVALGILGLPFQFMYAITGAHVGGMAALASIPIFIFVFNGDPSKMEKTFYPPPTINLENLSEPSKQTENSSLNDLLYPALKVLDSTQLREGDVILFDYGKKEGRALVRFHSLYGDGTQFTNRSYQLIRLADGLVLEEHIQATLAHNTDYTIKQLHYARFGGFFIKIVYFILSIVTCYVILSGVMIWLVARDKKTYAHKAKFNRNAGAIFIGACMGLYPAIALFFCLVKLFPERFGMTANVFFLFWLAYTVYSYFMKSTFTINKHALIIAGGFGLLIPLLNGIQSGLWFWKSLGLGYTDSFFVDVSWLVMSVITLWAAYMVKPVNKKVPPLETPEERPEGFKDDTIISKPVLNINPKAR